jgi:hypothetical protein
MSIYSLLFDLTIKEFDGESSRNIRILAVPAHIADVGPSWDFLPPPVDAEGRVFRAVVVIEVGQKQGTPRSVHEFLAPLLMFTGQEYHDIRFVELMYRIEEALDASHGQPEWKRDVGVKERRWYID